MDRVSSCVVAFWVLVVLVQVVTVADWVGDAVCDGIRVRSVQTWLQARRSQREDLTVQYILRSIYRVLGVEGQGGSRSSGYVGFRSAAVAALSLRLRAEL